MKIQYLTRYFEPDLQATSLLDSDLCQALSLKHQVTVVSGYPSSFARRKVKCLIYERVVLNGNMVHWQIGSFGLSKVSSWKRAVNYLSFLVNAFIANLFLDRPDLMIVTTTPPLLHAIGFILSWIHGVPSVLILYDLFPESAMLTGQIRVPILDSLLTKVSHFFLKKISHIVVLGVDMKKRLIDKGIDPSRIGVIHPWVAETQGLHPCPRNNEFSQEMGFDGKFVVLYAGNLGLAHNVEDLVALAEFLKNEPLIHFLIVGEGINKKIVKVAVKERDLGNITLLPFQSEERMNSVYATADCVLTLLKKNLWGVVIPSKINATLAVGRPSLVMADKESDLTRIVGESHSGLAVETGEIQKAGEFLLWLARNPEETRRLGQNARAYYERNCSRETALSQYESLIETLKLETYAKHKKV